MIDIPSPAIAIVGRHNSGKTTLIERLIAELVARGLDVGSIKHHSHRGFDIDHPGKDSYRHRAAGASETVIAAPGQVARVKTIEGEEQAMFVTGVNCNRDTAFQEMQAVKERFGKTGGNVAYHAYQSFKPGEVTPELCHRLGVELAKRMWGDEYQVLVATHFNTGTYHNHFVVNSVGLWDGKKFNCGKRAYYQFRQLSDDLCKEYQLSTIKNPKGKTPRSIYFAEKRGEPTKYNLMREALDAALKVSVDGNDLRKALREQGYELDTNPTHKYATLRRIGSKKGGAIVPAGRGLRSSGPP